MAAVHKVLFYPVGNGDTSQVVLAKGRRLLFDFCHREKAEEASTPEIDLKKRLRDELKEAKRDNFDVVAFTHGDLDHIQGSTDFFALDHSTKYQGGDRIKATEFWMPAAMLLAEADDNPEREEYVLRKEGRHRLLEGTGILVFSRPKPLIEWLEGELTKRNLPKNARDHLFVDAGKLVPGFDLKLDGAEVFCHSPFIKHGETEDIIRNEASLIFNVRLDADGSVYDYLEVGDSQWEVLEEVVDVTKKHNNTDRLEWDLFNIPHHCSYLALSDEKGTKETEPKPLLKELLLLGKTDAYIVSSSNPIPDIKDAYEQLQPPHIQAKNAYVNYLKQVAGRKFLVTMEEPNANQPEPIEFEVSANGVSWKRSSVVGAAALARSTPPRAG